MKTSKMRIFLLSLALILVMTSIVAVNVMAAGDSCTKSGCRGTYVNGFCNVCDGYQPAVLTTDKYDMDGDGAMDEVYEIGNAGQLYWFASYNNGIDNEHINRPEDKPELNAILTDDITVNENVLNTDGTLNGDINDFRLWEPIHTYVGIFDGKGYAISGLCNDYDPSIGGAVGLFSGTWHGSTVKNLGIEDSFFWSIEPEVGGTHYYTGSVMGVNNGTVSNCYNTGTVSGCYDVGGVVGINSYGIVENCYNTGTVSGDERVGGVVGQNNETVRNCYNTGTVSGNRFVGGVVATTSCDGIVLNCYNTGAVSGIGCIGGVAGVNSDDSFVENCYNNGTVGGEYTVGGVVGSCHDAFLGNCYNNGAVSGEYDVGGVVGKHVDSIVRNCYNMGTVSGEHDIGGVVGRKPYYTDIYDTVINTATTTNCFYLDKVGDFTNPGGINGTDVAGQAEAKTAEQFASGELAWLLQNGVGQVSEGAPLVWGQNLDNGLPPHRSPVLTTNSQVYEGTDCIGNWGAFTNKKDGTTSIHTYSNGFCINCDSYQPAVWNETDQRYEIYNAGQLYWFAALINGDTAAVPDIVQNNSANAVLMNDITVNIDVLTANGALNGDGTNFRTWNPIGAGRISFDADSDYEVYAGHFDGQGFVISGLYFNDEWTGFVGLFGCIGTGAEVKNLGVEDSHFIGYEYVGGVAGWNEGTVTDCYNMGAVSGGYYVGGVVGENYGTVTNCYNTGTISCTDVYVGGVVGCNDGTVTNCYNTGIVSGFENVGGVVGYSSSSTVTDCYNTGTVSGTGFGIGGVVGCNDGTVTNCYNTGTVSGWCYVGGVVGECDGIITNCYNTGVVNGDGYIGGVVGMNSYGIVENCYNTGTVSGIGCIGGVAGWNSGTVTNCYNTGNVSGEYDIGGVVGYNDSIITNCYNTGTISGEFEVGGVVGAMREDVTYPVAVTNCYYLDKVGNVSNPGGINGTDVAGQAEAKTLEQFASGEVAYLLNDGQANLIFGQTIGTDPYPVFYNGENQVYFGSFCPSKREAYANVPAPAPEVAAKHTFENVTCIYCGLNVYDYAVELEERIAALEAALEALETQHGADIAALQQQLDDLLAELNALKNNNYATADDLNAAVERIAALEAKVAELEASVAANAEAIAKLEQAIEDLKKAMEDKDSELAAKIAELEAALTALEEAYKAADAALEEKLTALINEAKAELAAAIKELSDRVTANESDIADLKAALELLQDKISTELLAKMEELIATLETVYATKEELATAVEELWAAINSGSEDLVQKIEKLRTTLNAAIAANNATAIELTEQINKAKSALQSVINKLEADLTAAMLAGDSALDEKITALQAALDAAIAACDADDEALKQQLKDAMATVNAAIKANAEAIAINTEAIADARAEMIANDNKLNTLVIVAIVVAGVAMAGCAGLVTYIIIDKRKLIK